MSPIWYFEDVNLYNILCAHKWNAKKDTHIFRKYEKDQFIYFNDDLSSQIYLVAKGRVKIGSQTPDGREIVKAILAEGEIFGEMALIGQSYRNDFAQALEYGTTVCPMHVADLEELMAQNKNLTLQIYKIIGFRLQRLERKIESLVFKDVRTRVVEFIIDLATEKGQKIGYETKIINSLTHKDIANLTGTSRQTVTTILNELKERGIIHFDRRQILVRDMERLQKETDSIQ
jgi:CRP-like cAMP-binding protein